MKKYFLVLLLSVLSICPCFAFHADQGSHGNYSPNFKLNRPSFNFSPIDLTGLKLWLDANVGVLSFQCADFEDTNTESFSRADNTSLSTGDIDFSIATWVAFENLVAQDRHLVCKSDNLALGASTEYGLWYDQAANLIKFTVSDGVTLSSVSASTFGAPSTDTKYFIACGHDADDNVLWISVNGGTVDTAAYTGGVADSTFAFRLGYDGAAVAAEHHDGELDETSFWKRDIRSDISSLYNSGLGRSYRELTNTSNLQAYWSFGQPSFDSGLVDLSGNGNTLTDNNTVAESIGNTSCISVKSADGDQVSDWLDQSGQGNDIIYADIGCTWEENTINGYPVVQCDGVGYFSPSGTLDTYIANNAYGLFTVANVTSVATDSATITSNDAILGHASDLAGLYFRSTGPTAYVFNNDGSADSTGKTFTAGTSYLIHTRHDSGNIIISLNNDAEGSTASGNTSALTGSVYLGGGSVGFFTGKIANLTIQDVVPTASEISNMKIYNNNRYMLW